MNARTNDPATSKTAALIKRSSLRERMLAAMRSNRFALGWTGHELAAALADAPLNSVTPRLAELRRASKIEDVGFRRDGQIAWVLA